MKIEKLYKLTLNYNYTENDKMVFKYAFDMLFDIGLERNKAETIKFIQAIIDEGYFNRQELYKERSRKMEQYYTLQEVMARLNISRDTIMGLIRKGKIPGTIKLSNVFRIPESGIQRFLEA